MTPADIIRMAKQANIAHHGLGWTCWEGQLERFAALVAAAEREACAKLCESMDEASYPHTRLFPHHCAEAIRGMA